jgi:hypothetical protein
MTYEETGAKTLRELAYWIIGRNSEIGNQLIYVHDECFGDVPWHGVIRIEDNVAVIHDGPTKAELAQIAKDQAAQEAERRRADWNRAEVLEAKEKGLLP